MNITGPIGYVLVETNSISADGAWRTTRPALVSRSYDSWQGTRTYAEINMFGMLCVLESEGTKKPAIWKTHEGAQRNADKRNEFVAGTGTGLRTVEIRRLYRTNRDIKQLLREGIWQCTDPEILTQVADILSTHEVNA